MATRPLEFRLPDDIRTELERRLLSQGFADYASLHTWLQGQGYEIGLSTVKRFGKRFEERCEMIRMATRQAEAMKEHFGDDDQALAQASLQMAQTLIFNLMLERGEELTPKEMSLITRAVGDTSRAEVAVKKYQADLKDRIAAKLDAIGQESEAGITADTLRRVREEIYGLF